MKLSVLAGLIVLICVLGADVQAQDRALNIDVEAATDARNNDRVPKMVMGDPIIKVELVAKPSDTAKLSNSKTKGGNIKGQPTVADGVAGGTSQTGTTPKPIVIPAPVNGAFGLVEAGTTGNAEYDRMVMKSAAANGVDPGLVFAVMRQESGFNPRARSYKGASGLMQLMPATARRFGVVNIYDAAQNIEGGTRYLRYLVDMFEGDVNLVLAGYNAGEGAVVEAGYQIPRFRETQNYVKSISAKYGSQKSRSASKSAIASGPVAPAAVAMSGGRLSNNY